jgi:hypothetical protein
LGRGESITNKLKELTNGQDASVLAELAPGGIETTIECIRNLEPGGRVALIAPNPEPLNFAAALSDDSLDRIHQRHRALRHGRRAASSIFGISRRAISR